MNIEELQNLPDAEKAKLFAARHALKSVESDMRIGLGTGSTAYWFVKLLAHAHANGLDFEACATSSQTTELAESLGIKIESLDDLMSLELVVDGADEFDSSNNLIKGGGGALLQEKITARTAERFIVITDASKEVERLGKFPLPVEIVQFASRITTCYLMGFMATSVLDSIEFHRSGLRMTGGKPFITDEGHYILDLNLGSISDADAKMLDTAVRGIAGVVETGLFLNMAHAVVTADASGLVKSRETGGDWKETRYELAEISAMLADIKA